MLPAFENLRLIVDRGERGERGERLYSELRTVSRNLTFSKYVSLSISEKKKLYNVNPSQRLKVISSLPSSFIISNSQTRITTSHSF